MVIGWRLAMPFSGGDDAYSAWISGADPSPS